MASPAPIREEVTGVAVSEPTWLGKRLAPGSFVRSATALVSGTLVSQAIVFLLSPFLSRIFTPADFGHLANYNAWVSVLALVSNARYEHAIIVARGRIAMNRVLALTLLLSAVGTLVIALAATAIVLADPQHGYLGEIKDVVLFMPPAVAATVVISALTQFAIRRGHFKRLAWLSVLQVGVTLVLQIVLGWARVPHGLVIGALGGALVGCTAFVIAHLRKNRVRHVTREMSAEQLRTVALEYVNFPRYSLPADGINVVIQQFVPVFLTALFGPVVAGLYAFSTRVIRVPAFVVSTSVSTVLRKRAADHLQREGSLVRLLDKTVWSLLALAAGPFLIMGLFAHEIFAVVFGPEWRDAGTIVRILTPGMLLEFVAFPLTVFFLVTQTQRLAFRVQVMNLATLAAAFLGGKYLWDSFFTTCVVLSAGMILVNVTAIILARRVSARPPLVANVA